MIVIAPDRGRRMLAHPVDARNRFHPVLDEIADEQTGIERLVDDGAQRGPVGVNVGQHQNLHATLFPMPKSGFAVSFRGIVSRSEVRLSEKPDFDLRLDAVRRGTI